MWVERIVGTPHTWGLAVYPVAHGRFEPRTETPMGSYPVERDFPDLDCAPHEVTALWLGNAFEVNALILGVTAHLSGVQLPGVMARMMHVRGIGKIWIGSRAEARAVIDEWAGRARDRLSSGEALDPSDECMIRKLLTEIEKEIAMGMPTHNDTPPLTETAAGTAESASPADEASTAMDTEDMHDPVLPGVPPGKF